MITNEEIVEEIKDAIHRQDKNKIERLALILNNDVNFYISESGDDSSFVNDGIYLVTTNVVCKTGNVRTNKVFNIYACRGRLFKYMKSLGYLELNIEVGE